MKSPFVFVGLFLSMMFSCVSFLFLQSERINFHAVLEEGREVQEIFREEYRTVKDFWEAANREYLPLTLRAPSHTTNALLEALAAAGTEIPLFPGCEGISPFPLRAQCAFRKLGAFFNAVIDTERFAGRQGRVLLTFTVPTDGSVTRARLEENTDAHLAAELMRVIGVMQGKGIRWSPGKIDGRPAEMDLRFKFTIGGSCPDCQEHDLRIELVGVAE